MKQPYFVGVNKLSLKNKEIGVEKIDAEVLKKRYRATYYYERVECLRYSLDEICNV